MDQLREVFDFRTMQVLAAVSTSFGISMSNASDVVKLVTAIGACAFIWLKLYRAYKRKS